MSCPIIPIDPIPCNTVTMEPAECYPDTPNSFLYYYGDPITYGMGSWLVYLDGPLPRKY